MGQAKKSKDDNRIAERRVWVARLYLKGKSQPEIATELAVSMSTVTNDLAGIREEWIKSAVRDFDAQRSEELARIDYLESVAWDAWERSKKIRTIRHREVLSMIKLKGKDKTIEALAAKDRELVPISDKTKTIKMEAVGDPKFLDQVIKCIELRMKLLCLVKEDKPSTTNNYLINWEGMFERSEVKDPFEQLLGSKEIIDCEGIPVIPEKKDKEKNGVYSNGSTDTDSLHEPPGRDEK